MKFFDRGRMISEIRAAEMRAEDRGSDARNEAQELEIQRFAKGFSFLMMALPLALYVIMSITGCFEPDPDPDFTRCKNEALYLETMERCKNAPDWSWKQCHDRVWYEFYWLGTQGDVIKKHCGERRSAE